MRKFATLALSLNLLMLANCQAEVADGYVRTWVEKQFRQISGRFVRGSFAEIGWAESIQAAVETAKEHDRLVFLFTLDGKMDSGRC